MVPLEKLRELIPDSDKYTDEELTKIRSDMEAFANLAFDCWLAKLNKKPADAAPDAKLP